MAISFKDWLDSITTDFRNTSAQKSSIIGFKNANGNIIYSNFKQSTFYLNGLYLKATKNFDKWQRLKTFGQLLNENLKQAETRAIEFRSPNGRSTSSSSASNRSYRGPAIDYSDNGGDAVNVFEVVYKQYIVRYFNDVIKTNPNLKSETKATIKAWIDNPDNKKIMMKRLGMLGTSGSGTVSLNFQAIGTSLKVDKQNFYKALFNQTPGVKVIEALGFDLEIEKTAKNNIFDIANAEDLSIETLDGALRSGRDTAIDVVRSVVGITAEPTEEQKSNFKQCALVTALLHNKPIDGSVVTMRNYFQDSQSNSPLNHSTYTNLDDDNYRIYPVVDDSGIIDPNAFLNKLIISSETKDLMARANARVPNPTELHKQLFWIYKDQNKNELKELSIPLSSNRTLEQEALALRRLTRAQRILYGTKGTQQERQMRADGFWRQATGQIGGTASLPALEVEIKKRRDALSVQKNIIRTGYYYLDKASIKFEGTNPSTARNDVQVTLDFNLSSIAELSKVIINGKNVNSLHDTVEFRLMDLITLPNTRKTETKNSVGGFISNEYSPDYSRIRLKVKAGGDTKTNLIIDLSTIDHTISRQSETGEVQLTINYRGYFESTLNMPFNDALADSAIISDRTAVKNAMEDLVSGKEDCDPKTIRQALRIQQELISRQSRNALASSMVKRLLAKKVIHEYDINSGKLAILESYVNGEDDYVDAIRFSGGANNNQTQQAATDLETEIKKDKADANKIKTAKKLISNKFFFLGDLMHVVSDCLYKDNTATHRPVVSDLSLRFIVGTIYVPNPKNLNGPPLVINPCCLPIDLSFFIEWFNSTVTGRGLTYYPVGTFIRDLIEKVVNGIIYETCFSLVLPDENPPILRSRTFVTTKNKWFSKQTLIAWNGDSTKNYQGWFVPTDPYGQGAPDKNVDVLMEKNFKLQQNVSTPDVKVESKQYCVIYQQSPSFFRQIRAGGGKRPLKDDDHVPTIFYGQTNTDFNFISNVSFSKSDSPNLREARFFNTNYGGLSLLSNVYDLSFSFLGRVGNTVFYPGSIINFILLDWATTDYKTHPSGDIKYNGPLNLSDFSSFGDSNPHKEGTIANIMGMGGYFIIKSVEYELGEVAEDFEIKISTKFLGNDGQNGPARKTNETPVITDKANCVTSFNDIATRANALIDTEAGDQYFDLAVVSSGSASPGATRATSGSAGTTPAPANNLENWMIANYGGQYQIAGRVSLDPNNHPQAKRLAIAMQQQLQAAQPPVGTIKVQSVTNQRQFLTIDVAAANKVTVTPYKRKN